MPYPTIGHIERLDPRLAKLIPSDAAVEVVAEGFAWAEGPVWRHADGALLFTDIPNNRVHRWKDGEGLSVFMEPAGYTGATPRGGELGANGLTFDAQGRLTMCEHGDRRVTRVETDGAKTVLAARFEGQRLNSPNDLVYHPDGDLIFTDPPYGLEGGPGDPARETDFCGIYVVRRDGRVELLSEELTRPNGLAFSPDRKTLYVANSDPARAAWVAYAYKGHGALLRPRTFADHTKEVARREGLPDGLKVDRAGNVWATGPGGVCVFTPQGELLGRISAGAKVSNCAWGDDGSTLYLTATSRLCRIRVATRGDRWPG